MPKIVNRGPAGLLSKDGKKLVNRGGAGLLSSKKEVGKEEKPAEAASKAIQAVLDAGKKDHFLPELAKLLVAIGKPVPDPNNARLHPERNMEAIMLSLARYGQRTPIVINRRTGHVLKGNGTLQAAKNLGWTKIAAVWCNDDDATAAGYGLADNRSAEFARWDFEVVARLQKLVEESAGVMVGWSKDELEVLRLADWTPPEQSEDKFSHGPAKIEFTEKQREAIDTAIIKVQTREGLDVEAAIKFGLTPGECLRVICSEWLETQ